jgi:uncharacterized protein involved in exopolysaccharide biosynthesis
MDIFELPGILLKRWLYVLVPAVLCLLVGGAYVVTVKPTVPVTTDVFIDPQGLVAEKGDLVPQVGAANQDQAVLESQVYVLQSSEILNDVVEKLDLTNDPFLSSGTVENRELAVAATVGALQKHLTIERAGQSFILNLTFKHRDPVRGAEIVNTIAATYLKKVHESRNDASNRASGAFEMQAQTLAARVRKAETELETFKAAHGLVSTGQQGLVIDQQVEGVNKQLISARADLGAKRASFEQARSLTVGSVQDGAIPEALASTALGSMRARYADLAATLNELSSSLGANHPQMRAARSQVDGMREAIEQELARIRKSLESAMERSQANVAALESRLAELTKSSLDTSEAGIKARELQSQVETLRALYKALLSRSEELGQRDTVNINNSRIISKAVAIGSSSRLAQLMILIAAGLFGVAAGCGLAVLREMLGRVFHRRQAAIGTPVAGADAPAEPAADAADPDPETPLAPVIAHLPARRAVSPLSRFSNAPRTQAARDIVTSAEASGITMTVDRIVALQRRDRPSTIVLMAASHGGHDRELARDIADALYRRQKDVLFARGDRAAGTGLLADVPLGDVLRFQRLTPLPQAGNEALAPTFRNFASRHGKVDFVIIDARGEEARRHLDRLLPEADGIIVLASEGDDAGQLERLLKTLDPWKDRMLGTILYDQAA